MGMGFLMNITFGPVPSRRLGRSLGINNIPPKWCSYACVYCQIGNTLHMRRKRRIFYETDVLAGSVRSTLELLKEKSETLDYLAFVPDGEPTLDSRLGNHIDALKNLGIPVAVISNASLINEAGVQDALCRADWVSLKTDTVRESTWRRMNRPHGRLHLSSILNGALAFRQRFTGRLVTETMLIRGLNDSEPEAEQIAHFLLQLKPDKAYISVPTRPPADKGIRPALPESVNRAWQLISEIIPDTELLTGYEGNAFFSGGDLRKDILRITAVHPLRDDAVDKLVADYGHEDQIIEKMILDGQIRKTWYRGHHYYLRNFDEVLNRNTGQEKGWS